MFVGIPQEINRFAYFWSILASRAASSFVPDGVMYYSVSSHITSALQLLPVLKDPQPPSRLLLRPQRRVVSFYLRKSKNDHCCPRMCLWQEQTSFDVV
ncbi:unnamed protein product [Amoebophrya sp. A25]|nr:unnamed protein product [Amoebophrya sp. A25]|eukprot:GSA25T00017311001.1